MAANENEESIPDQPAGRAGTRRTGRRRAMRDLAIGGGAALAGAALANGLTPDAAEAAHAHPLEGVWLVDLRRSETPRPDRHGVLTAFDPDGGVTVVVEPSFDSPEGARHHQSHGLGHWEKVGDREFKYNYILNRHSERGAFVHHLIVRANITLNEAEDRFSGTFSRERVDGAGNILHRREGTATGRRVLEAS